jgi:hypothetical protein
MPIHKKFKDALLIVSTAAPAAGASANGTALDLRAGRKPFGQELEVSFPAIAALADTKNLVVTFQDSDDNSTFGANLAFGSAKVTGAGGAGSAASYQYLPIPVDAKQYVRPVLTLDAAGGTITASSVTVSVVY